MADRAEIALRRVLPISLAAGAALYAAPASAERVQIDVPAGRVVDVAIAIAQQTGTSIVIADSAIAARRAGAIRGRIDAEEAVRRLARAAGARAVPAGNGAWRLVAADRKRQARTPTLRAGEPSVVRSAGPVPAEVSGPPIIVVASKRDLTLEQMPGQISLLDGETLQFGGVGGTERITRQLATVSSTHLGSGRNKLFIRGVADSSFAGPTQATVGQYLGDLRLSYNAPDPDLRLSDLARVEVLEGPQGTLYGAGSLGGIIRLVPNAPELGLAAAWGQAGASATWHGEPGFDASATFNLPVTDASALRVTVDGARLGGYIDKPALGKADVNRTAVLGGRGIARVEFAPGWSVDLIGLIQSTDSADSQYADRGGPPLSRDTLIGEGSDSDYAQGQLVISGELGELRLRSSTGITGQDLLERYDATSPGSSPRIFTQSNHTEMFANETRIWKPQGELVGWVLGASYTHNRMRLERELEDQVSKLTAGATGVRNAIDEVTVYGELSLRMLDHLIATGGARYTRSTLGGEGLGIPQALLSQISGIVASRKEHAFLPSVSLLADVMPGTALYVRYQEGFRPGGLAVDGAIVRRFENDRTATLEFGARHGQPGRGPFDVAANISYTRWSDIQADYLDPAGFPSTANIGDGRVWSGSVTGSVRLASALRIDLGVTVNKSKVDEPQLAYYTGRVTQVPNIAGFAGHLGLDYMVPVAGDWQVRARAWANYIGRSRLGVGPELGDLQGDYLDSGLTVRFGRPRYGISLGVTNLADVKGNRFALGTPFVIDHEQVTPLRPRTVRLGFDAAF